MSLLSAAELAEVRALAESGMAGTAMILTRITIETDDGTESQWATVGDEVPCWVKEVASNAATLGAISGAVGIAEPFSIRLPYGSQAFSGDKLAVGSQVYLIQHANNEDTYGPWLMCACRPTDD